MGRKIGAWLAAGLVVLYFIIPVYAAVGDETFIMKPVSGYCLGEELYMFVCLKDGYDVESFKVSLQSDAVTGSDTAAVTPVVETDCMVHYVFMVDLSGSMRQYIDEVNTFVEAVAAQERQKAVYTVTTFGEKFEVVRENLTDKNAVIKVLNELKYTEWLTDPYTGVESALTYLDSISMRSGDVINLIIITDGDPDLGYEDTEKEKGLAQSAADRIEKTPEVIVSTICTAKWDTTAYEAFSTGTGIHEQINGSEEAQSAGEKTADYVDGLFRIQFQLEKNPDKERFDAQMQVRGSNADGQLTLFTVDLKDMPNLKMFSNSNQEIPLQTEPSESESIVKESESGESKSQTQSETESETGTGTESETASEESAVQEKSGKNGSLIPVLSVTAVIIAASVCIFVLFYKGKRGKKQGTAASDGIIMKLEVYAGNCVSRKTTFYLKESLLIGSSKKCDLVFANPEVTPENARIFVKDGLIYIEDLNSNEGTALGEMRIQGQNRLRSGDVISIGTVEFSLKF